MRLPLLLACITLAACSLLPPQPAPPVVYDFGTASAAAPANAPAALQVQAPPWLDGAALLYRLAYADGTRLTGYRDSRWAAAPAALLHEHLRQRLARAPGAPAARTLRIEIEEFCQVFDAPTRSRGVLRLRAMLSDGTTGRLLRQQAFEQAVVAATPDAAGGAHALAAAAAQAAARVLDWAAQPG